MAALVGLAVWAVGGNAGRGTRGAISETANSKTPVTSRSEPDSEGRSVKNSEPVDRGDYEKSVDSELTATYIDCVRGVGVDVDVDVADVIVNPEGHPVGVKSSPVIPALAHGPCFAQLGGSVVPGQSAQDDTIFLDCTDPLVEEIGTICHEDFAALASPKIVAPESSSVDGNRSVKYQECVGEIDAGLSKFSIKIFQTPEGKIAGIKVDGEVPADTHGFCYATVGGLVIGGTSSNEQVWIDDCSAADSNVASGAQHVLNCAEENQSAEVRNPRES